MDKMTTDEFDDRFVDPGESSVQVITDDSETLTATSLYSDQVDVDGDKETIVADGETDTVVDEETGEWEGILAVEGVETGDARKFSQGALKWAEPPIPLMWAPANMGAHQGAVMAGRIERIWRDPANPAMIRGSGTFDLNGEHGREAFRQVKDKYLKGISIDPDSIADADIEMQFDPSFDTEGEDGAVNLMQKPSLTVFHGGRIRAATLVQIPAFVEAQISLATREPEETVTAAAHPLDVINTSWSAFDNDVNVPSTIPLGTARAVYAYVGPSSQGKVSKFDCRFLHHVVNAVGEIGPANVHACETAMTYLNSNRSAKLDRKRLKRAYEHLAQHIRDAGREPPAFAHGDPAEELVACGGTDSPPREWFDNPKLAGPTPFTVTDDGRVFGHAALWGSCHTSFANSCVQPPYEADYGFFTTGEVVTADGTRVAAGQITLGTSHAATRGVTAMQAVDHYGDTGTSVADVAAGSDEHGIWVAGAVRPGTDHSTLHALRASALSGDWRRLGGALRMVALLAVNVPGFPIPRTTTTIQGDKQLTLVAAGMVTEDAVNEAKLAALKTQVLGGQTTTFDLGSLQDRVFGWNPEDHPRGKAGKFIDSLDDAIETLKEKVTGISGPKRYGPNGERNYPLDDNEKPTPSHVIRRQEKDDLKRVIDREQENAKRDPVVHTGRYGPNGERNYPLTEDEKPTPERVLRKQDRDYMKRMSRD